MRLAGDFDIAAIAAVFAAGGRNRPAERCALVGPDHDFAAIAIIGCRCIDNREGINLGRIGIRDRTLALIAATDLDLAAAKISAGSKPRCRQCNLFARDDNVAAFCRFADGRHCGSVDDHAAFASIHYNRACSPLFRGLANPLRGFWRGRITAKADAAVCLFDAVGFDIAGNIDRGGWHGGCGGGLQLHPPAIRLDAAGLGHQRARLVRARGRHAHRQQAVAGQIHGDIFARGQPHGAFIGLNRAAVFDMTAHQHDRAAIFCGDLALVDHIARAAHAFEARFPAQKIRIGDIERRADKGIGPHRASRRDENAIRIDEIELAIRAHLSGNGGRCGPVHPVQGGAVGIWHIEQHLVAGTNRETIPADDGAIRGLVDLHRAGRRHANGRRP